MPSTPSSSSSSSSVGHSSLLPHRRDQVHAMDASTPSSTQLDSFQSFVADQLHPLLLHNDNNDDNNENNNLLSLSWLSQLLDAFSRCESQFSLLLFSPSSHLPPSPHLHRSLSEFLDRSLKAVDICNAVRHGIDLLRQWHRHLDIVLSALLPTSPPRPGVGEAQLRRAHKALFELSLSMSCDKDSSAPGSLLAHRNRSFGRHDRREPRPAVHSRSLSWSVSRSWSAARQLHAIAAGLAPPRSAEIAATAGLIVPVFTMNSLLLFMTLALVAAIPCQDRGGLQVHFLVPRHFPWAATMLLLHDRIIEESKKRERKNSNGLLSEMYLIEKCTRRLSDLIDTAQCPLTGDQEAEVRTTSKELSQVCDSLKDGLDVLERRVRDIFRQIVGCRTKGLDYLGKMNNPE